MSMIYVVGVMGCNSHEPMRTQNFELPKDDAPLYTVPQKVQAGMDDIVFTNYDASFEWKTNDGVDCVVKVILPALNSMDESAEEYAA